MSATIDPGKPSPLPVLLLLVLTFFAVNGGSGPLESSRPNTHDESPAPRGARQVELRLWEDPLDGFRSGQKPLSDAELNERDVLGALKRFNHSMEFARDKTRLVLPVVVPSGNLPRSIEKRIRTRYAVLSALHSSGFVPKDTRSLSEAYFVYDHVAPGELGELNLPKHYIHGKKSAMLWTACRYEVLERDDFSVNALYALGESGSSSEGELSSIVGEQNGDSPKPEFDEVVLVWLDGKQFSDRFFDKCESFNYGLRFQSFQGYSEKPYVTILGPADSEMLGSAVEDYILLSDFVCEDGPEREEELESLLQANETLKSELIDKRGALVQDLQNVQGRVYELEERVGEEKDQLQAQLNELSKRIEELDDSRLLEYEEELKRFLDEDGLGKQFELLNQSLEQITQYAEFFSRLQEVHELVDEYGDKPLDASEDERSLLRARAWFKVEEYLAWLKEDSFEFEHRSFFDQLKPLSEGGEGSASPAGGAVELQVSMLDIAYFSLIAEDELSDRMLAEFEQVSASVRAIRAQSKIYAKYVEGNEVIHVQSPLDQCKDYLDLLRSGSRALADRKLEAYNAGAYVEYLTHEIYRLVEDLGSADRGRRSADSRRQSQKLSQPVGVAQRATARVRTVFSGLPKDFMKSAADLRELIVRHQREKLQEYKDQVRLLDLQIKAARDEFRSIKAWRKALQGHLGQRDRNEGQFELISPFATAYFPWIMALKDGDSETGIRERLRTAQNWGPEFRTTMRQVREELKAFYGCEVYRNIHTDRSVCQELVAELGRRGHFKREGYPLLQLDQFNKADKRVLVVGEWDSLYSRMLTNAFLVEYYAELERRQFYTWLFAVHDHLALSKASRLVQRLGLQWFPNMKSFLDRLYFIWQKDLERQLGDRVAVASYLSGIDGKSTRSRSKEGQDDGDKPQNNEQGDGLYLHPPVGSSQFDYLRRLSNRFAVDGDGLVSVGQTYDSVVILGGDAYDKLLIMRALRDMLPHARFYTTDVDMIYTHPRELKWTRNLVIAASYGTALARRYQKNVPPFRGTYQTAVFTATMQAVGSIPQFDAINYTRDDPNQEDPERPLEPVYITPRIFEVGNGSLYDLSEAKSTGGGRADEGADGVIKRYHPEREDVPFKTKIPLMGHEIGLELVRLPGFIIAAGVGMLLCVIGVWGRPRFKLNMLNWFCSAVWIGYALGVIGMVYYLYVQSLECDLNGGGEPYAWLSGVSMWPAEFFRYGVLIFSGFALIRVFFAYHKDCEQIASEFGFTVGECKAKRRVPFGWRAKIAYLLTWPFGLLKDGMLAMWHTVCSFVAVFFPDKSDASVLGIQWERYCGFRKSILWLLLCFGLALVYMIFGSIFIYEYGRPSVPYRGQAMYEMDMRLLRCSLLAMITLLFVVVFHSCRSARLLRTMYRGAWTVSGGQFQLPVDATMKPERQQLYQHYQCVRFAARVAKGPSAWVLYPFLALTLTILARMDYFDRWSWSLPLALVVLSCYIILILSALTLRYQASRVRNYAKTKLQTEGLKFDEDYTQSLIETIDSMKHGVYAPLSANPILLAVLTPLGGIGTVNVMAKLAESL